MSVAVASADLSSVARPVFDPARDRIRLVVNPISGAGRGAAYVTLAERILHGRGINFEICHTAEQGHGEVLAREAAEAGFRIVVAVGGDGTVNEIARGLVGRAGTALAILPCGSGNGLARHLGVSLAPRRAVERLTRASFQKIDVGYINERPFFCTSGLGFDAHVSRMFATLKKRGLASYLGLTIREFRRYRPTPVEIEINSEVIHSDCYVLAFANAAQYGNNAKIAPLADIRDGLLDVCLIDALPLRRALRVSIGLMTGTLAHSGAAEFHTSREVLVRSEKPIGFHVDGDFIGESTEHSVRLTPLALEVAT